MSVWTFLSIFLCWCSFFLFQELVQKNSARRRGQEGVCGGGMNGEVLGKGGTGEEGRGNGGGDCVCVGQVHTRGFEFQSEASGEMNNTDHQGHNNTWGNCHGWGGGWGAERERQRGVCERERKEKRMRMKKKEEEKRLRNRISNSVLRVMRTRTETTFAGTQLVKIEHRLLSP